MEKIPKKRLLTQDKKKIFIVCKVQKKLQFNSAKVVTIIHTTLFFIYVTLRN